MVAPNAVEAILLAGGEGKRLRPLTNNRPKPMVEILGKPILQHQIEHLANYGITRFIIACCYKWEVIRNFFGDGSRFGVEIVYSVEKELLGRGGAIREAYCHVPTKERPVIATNGDNIFDIDINKLLKQHQDSKALTTITLTQLRSPYGIVEVDGTTVKAFKEKIVLPHWVNAGVYVISPKAFKHFPRKGDHERSTFPQFAKDGKLSAYLHQGYWRAVDNMKDLAEAEKFLG